jgi:hypothetical protein
MITNNFNLPEQFIRALNNLPYSRGASDISVTQLISAPYQRRMLKKLEQITDASDMVKATLGTAFHEFLHRYGSSPNAISEQRLNMTVGGWVVSGAIDNIEDNVIWDTKTTSVWAFKLGGKEDWEKQLNVYAQLCREAHRKTGDDRYRIDGIKVAMYFTDFVKAAAGFDGNPPANAMVIEVPLWDEATAVRYIEERVALHQQEEPEPCTDEERWATKEVFALMKDKRKSAIKLYDTRQDAEAARSEKDASHYVEARPKTFRRCNNYCAVSHMCPHHNSNGGSEF